MENERGAPRPGQVEAESAPRAHRQAVFLPRPTPGDRSGLVRPNHSPPPPGQSPPKGRGRSKSLEGHAQGDQSRSTKATVTQMRACDQDLARGRRLLGLQWPLWPHLRGPATPGHEHGGGLAPGSVTSSPARLPPGPGAQGLRPASECRLLHCCGRRPEYLGCRTGRHGLGGLNDGRLRPHGPRGWMPSARALAVPASPAASLLAPHGHLSLPRIAAWPSLCVCALTFSS